MVKKTLYSSKCMNIHTIEYVNTILHYRDTPVV